MPESMNDLDKSVLAAACDSSYAKMEQEVKLLLLYNTPFRLARVVEAAGDHQRAVAQYHTVIYGRPL